MKRTEFTLLKEIFEGKTARPAEDPAWNALESEGLVNSAGITEKGEGALAPYAVKNAIIMAAGYSARCMPLSNVMPKGLFVVKGEVLIEREIRQLLEAGIKDIIVVTGFMHEKYEYLQDKYGVKTILNSDYDKYNNMSSLYAAREYIDRSYILCCDNYYENNVFSKYVYSSYYSCVYSEKYCDEFCVTDVDENGIIKAIHRGGDRSWYTIGDAYFDHDFSKKFVAFMEAEWEQIETRKLLMDDFHIRHISDLPLVKVERPAGSIMEFDTLEEIYVFDPEFKCFVKENLDQSNVVNQIFDKYSEVKSYHSVPTEQLSGRLHLNENLFMPSPKCLDVLKEATIEDLYLYDLGHDDELITALSKDTGISANNIFVHHGSSEVIKSIGSILLNEGDIVLIPAPGWSYYKSVADTKFAKCVTYEVREEEDSYAYNVEDILAKAKELKPKLIVITSPQMPTGCEISAENIYRIVADNPNSVIMLDEAYWGYQDVSNKTEKALITEFSNVVITRTFSKFYGLADVRIGYGLCSYPLRRTIGLDLPLFRAWKISRKVAKAAIEDHEYYDQMREETRAVREWFSDELNKIDGVKAYRSGSNFVFIKLKNADAKIVRAFMEENNILIRLFTDKDDLRLRITIGPKDIMERVVFQLKKALLYSKSEIK